MSRSHCRRRRAVSHLLQVALLTLAVAVVPVAQAPSAAALPSTSPASTWVTNGSVRAVRQVGSFVYIGGSFTRVGPPTGHAAVVDPGSGAHVSGSPVVNGDVFAAVPDGQGGWYLGGQFTAVNGVPRLNAARVLAGGAVSQWNPFADGLVRTIVRVGDRVFLGGDFTRIKTAPRLRVAAVDAVTGAPDPAFRPRFNAPVHSIDATPDGTQLVVGGAFTTVDDRPRERLDVLDATSGEPAMMLPPAANALVRSVAVAKDGTRFYAGGDFTVLAALPRSHVAAVDLRSGLPVGDWNPGADGPVHTIALANNDGRVFLGGAFTRVANEARPRAAALQANGRVLPWYPNPNKTVTAIALSPDDKRAALGGQFTSLRQTPASFGGVVDTGGGVPEAGFNLAANAGVNDIAWQQSGLMFGGNFTSVGSRIHRRLARLHASTGALDTTWQPEPDAEVLGLEASDDGATVYAVGRFTTIAGAARGRGAAFAATSGALQPWNPAANGVVTSLDVAGASVYLGGGFSQVGGGPAPYAAKVSAASGARDSAWLPLPNNVVYTVDVDPSGSPVYLGGQFTLVGVEPRNHLAAIGPNGLATPWNPNPPHHLLGGDVSPDGSVYYAGLGGTGGGGNSVNAITTDPSATYRWVRQGTGDVQVVEVSPNGATVYAGGHFKRALPDLEDRKGIMALAAADGAVLPWNADLDVYGLGVWAIDAQPSVLNIGGDFRRSGPAPTQGIARYPGTP